MNPTPSSRRTVLLTGATGAIGRAIARHIAATPGYEIVLVGRDRAKTERIANDVRQATGNDRVRYELADLSRQVELEALANRWQGPLSVLINNAAAAPRSRQETPEGIERQWATNVLSYFWLTNALRPALAAAAPARVVNVASYWAGDLDLDDVEFKRRPYRNGTAYRQSKQANRMLTVAQAERLAADGIAVNVCHPGDVRSTLSQSLGFGGSESADSAARTPVWLATTPAGQENSGRYFEHQQAVPDRFARDKAAVARLYELCQSYQGRMKAEG